MNNNEAKDRSTLAAALNSTNHFEATLKALDAAWEVVEASPEFKAVRDAQKALGRTDAYKAWVDATDARIEARKAMVKAWAPIEATEVWQAFQQEAD